MKRTNLKLSAPLHLNSLVNSSKRYCSTPSIRIAGNNPTSVEALNFARETIEIFKHKLEGIISDPNNRYTDFFVELDISLHPEPVFGICHISQLGTFYEGEILTVESLYLRTLEGAIKDSEIREGESYVLSSVKFGVAKNIIVSDVPK